VNAGQESRAGPGDRSLTRKVQLRRREATKTLSERRSCSVFGPEAYREYVEGTETRNESCSQGISSRSRRQMHFSGLTRNMPLRRCEAMKTLSETPSGTVFGLAAYREYVEGMEMRTEPCSQGISSRSRRQKYIFRVQGPGHSRVSACTLRGWILSSLSRPPVVGALPWSRLSCPEPSLRRAIRTRLPGDPAFRLPRPCWPGPTGLQSILAAGDSARIRSTRACGPKRR